MFAEIFEIIGVFIGVIAILIVVWDHFKDDRLLFRQVQEFYEDIEGLIYSYCLIYKSEEESPIKNPKQQNTFYSHKIKQNFEKYSNYLGLTILEEANRYYYCNISDFDLGDDGILHYNHEGEDRDDVINPHHPSSEEVNVIDEYLKMLRNYWERNYSKPLFRPKLKKKNDFSIIIDHKYWRYHHLTS